MSAIINFYLDEMERKLDEKIEEKRICKIVNNCHVSFIKEPTKKTEKAVTIMIEKALEMKPKTRIEYQPKNLKL